MGSNLKENVTILIQQKPNASKVTSVNDAQKCTTKSFSVCLSNLFFLLFAKLIFLCSVVRKKWVKSFPEEALKEA